MAAAVFGRENTLVAVEALLASARHGLAGLVLEGDPGIGKTTVWRKGLALAVSEGYRVLSCRSVPTEARLSFAALGDLLAPVEPAAFETLPGPQHRALDAALLRSESDGSAPNPLAIGTGFVSLLRQLTAAAPPTACHRRYPVARHPVGARARVRPAPARVATDSGPGDTPAG